MPYKNNVKNKNITKEREKKYTLVVTNIPEGYFNTFVHWEDIWCGKFMSDYYTTDEVSQVIHSLHPIQKMCIVKVYRCSINSITGDEIDSELEIKID